MHADKQDKEFKYKELTAKIIEIFYRVYNKLGYGFLEKVYENALRIDIGRRCTQIYRIKSLSMWKLKQ